MNPYKFIWEGGTGEIEEKKSRFIAHIQPIASEEEASAFIQRIKKEYWDARHNCSAFTLGANHETTRCSDDGEPSGTAGRPMLEVLTREDIHDCAVVVTRYFGGTLLGTGGLVRAYQAAVQAGLAASRIALKQAGRTLTVRADYTDFGRLQYLTAQQGLSVLRTDYAERVEMELMVPEDRTKMIETLMTDSTGARAELSWSDPLTFAEVNGEVIPF